MRSPWRPAVLAAVITAHAGIAAALMWSGVTASPQPPVIAAPALTARLIAEDEPPVPPRASPPEPPLPAAPKPVVVPPRPKQKAPQPAQRPQPHSPAPASTTPAPSAPAMDSAAPSATGPTPAPPSPASPGTEAARPPPPQHDPAAITCRIPSYPAEARRRGETGTVLLGLLIDTNGTVIDRRIERSSGSPLLDEAAVAALSKCRFRPGTIDGRPQQAWARLRYVWKLE